MSGWLVERSRELFSLDLTLNDPDVPPSPAQKLTSSKKPQVVNNSNCCVAAAFDRSKSRPVADFPILAIYDSGQSAVRIAFALHWI